MDKVKRKAIYVISDEHKFNMEYISHSALKSSGALKMDGRSMEVIFF